MPPHGLHSPQMKLITSHQRDTTDYGITPLSTSVHLEAMLEKFILSPTIIDILR